MICQKCGFENTPGDRLCAKCQNDLDFRALDSQMININDLELVKEKQKQEQKQTLEEHASKNGSHKKLWLFIIVLIIVTGIFVAVAKPIYDAYLKAEIISEAVIATRMKIERYAREHRSWPMSVSDIKGVIPEHSKGELDIKISNGVIELYISEEPGKKARFSPSINDRGYIVWKCSNGGFSQDYLPAICFRGQ